MQISKILILTLISLSLLSPIQSMDNNRSTLCSICMVQCITNAQLILHVRQHHPNQHSFQCNICNKGFSVQSNLISHIKYHHASKQIFKCTQCGKVFTNKSNLTHHIRSHTGKNTNKRKQSDKISRSPKTKLRYASIAGDLDSVIEAVSAGVDIKDINKALSAAISNGYFDMVKFLLNNGACIDNIDYVGRTHLIDSICKGKFEIFSYLIENGANINISCSLGNTPLMYAILYNNPKIVAALLNAGANIYLKNKDNKTAVDIAKEQNFNIRKLLIAKYTNMPNDIASIISQYDNNEIFIKKYNGYDSNKLNLLEEDILLLETFGKLWQERQEENKSLIIAMVVSTNQNINGNPKKFIHYYEASTLVKYLFGDLSNISNEDFERHKNLIKGMEFTIPAKKYYLNPLNGLPITDIQYFRYNTDKDVFEGLCSHNDMFYNKDDLQSWHNILYK